MNTNRISPRHRGSLRRVAALVALTLAAHAAAGDPAMHLVKDIDTTPDAVGSDPKDFRTFAGNLYFTANVPASGAELYVSNGVTARLVTDLRPGPASSNAVALGHAGGRLVVAADDGSQEYVASLDETSGDATRLTNLWAPRPQGYSRSGVIGPVGNRLLFTLGESRQVWGSDGTPAGTAPLFSQQTDTAIADRVCRLPQRAVALVATAGNGFAFWRSDATPAGTVSFATIAGTSYVRGVAASAGQCYFLIDKYPGWQIWRSDGVGASVIASIAGGGALSLAVIGNVAYVADTTGSRFRVWRSDQTQPFVDLPRGTAQFDQLFALGDRLLFGAGQEGSPNQAAFYSSNGTAAGTQRLTPNAVMPQTGFPPYVRAAGQALIVGDQTATWRIDATTGQVTSLGGRLELLSSSDVAEFGGALIGAQQEVPSTTIREVWRSDGSAAGTRLLHDIRTATRGALADFGGAALVVGDTLLFNEVIDRPLQFPLGRRALWRTDGSAAGTRALPRSLYGEGSVLGAVEAGDALVVRTTSDGLQSDMYRVDAGLASGVRIVADAVNGGLYGIPGAGALMSCTTTPGARDLCALREGENQAGVISWNLELHGGSLQRVGSAGGALLFYLGLPDHGLRGLWRSDATAPGTVRLLPDLVRSSSGGTPSVKLGTRLLFDGRLTPGGAIGLYASDATVAGTALLQPLDARVTGLQRWHDGRAVFLVDTNPTQLWFSDGTGAGTVRALTLPTSAISGARRVGDRLHLIGTTVGSRLDYVVTDGTAAGTRTLALPAELVPGSSWLAALDETTALFRCRTDAIGEELCAVDAGGDNARIVGDIYPGPASSNPRLIGSTPSATYIAADDSVHGRELWRVPAQSDPIFAHDFDLSVIPSGF